MSWRAVAGQMAIYRQRAFPSFVGCISAQRNARGLCSRNALSFLTGFERASRSLAWRKQTVVPLAGGGWVILSADHSILKDLRGGLSVCGFGVRKGWAALSLTFA